MDGHTWKQIRIGNSLQTITDTDAFILENYGLKVVSFMQLNYDVVDDKKFTKFLLRFG